MAFDSLGVFLRRILDYLIENYKKILLALLLVPAIYLVDKMEFPKIDAFIRDSLQYLNSSDEVDKRIVTVNIDTFSSQFKKPFSTQLVLSIISSLNKNGAKSIVLLFEPNDLLEPEVLITELKSISNVYVDSHFDSDSSFKIGAEIGFQRFLKFDTTSDSTLGAKDRKLRRAMLHYKDRGDSPTFDTASILGLDPFNIAHFKHSFNLWETKQAYIKTFKTKSFGFYDSQEIDAKHIKDKVVLLGAFDEWSKSASPSIFNLFERLESQDIRQIYFPYQSKVANLLNFHSTGNYIKLGPFNDIFLISGLLLFMIFGKQSPKIKIIILVATIPACILFTGLTYFLSSFYFDFSRTIGVFFFLQYLSLPAFLFWFFKDQELKKFEEINSARIDSLLLVSEKVAHDIRSPLSAVNLVLSRVEFKTPDEQEIVRNSLLRIDEVAANILSKYKSSTGTNYDSHEEFNVLHIMNGLIAEKRIIAPYVKYSIESKNGSIGKGHKLELERVLSNVLDNSIQALGSTNEAKIHVAIVEFKHTLLITIGDNGHGISSDVLKLLGSRPITTKTTGNSGNGIALLHAKRIVERMNGQLNIESLPGHGTTVKIEIPV